MKIYQKKSNIVVISLLFFLCQILHAQNEKKIKKLDEKSQFDLPVDNVYHYHKSKINASKGRKSLFNLGDVLVSRAVLPAASFAEGPTSGQYIGKNAINEQPVPFINKQPIQGFSSILNNYDGTFTALSDNGFGSIENSADYNLRLYKILPSFKSAIGYGSGEIEVLDFIELKDPNKLIPFAIVNHFTEDRVLTGADFDIESIQRTSKGDYWIGEEFGPFLLHFNSNGVLLDAPIALPDLDNEGKELRAPQNPYNEESSALRVMNTVRAHAQQYNAKEAPVLTTWHLLLDDDNPNTVVPSRKNPPAGLKAASSEIYNIKSIQKAGHKLVVYTVNDSTRMRELLNLGLDGIITDRPDLLLNVLRTFDKDNDGKPDFIKEDGLIDVKKFDAEGHRGARDLRPENTLPAMEVALDYLMPTLETDFVITSDNVVMLNHEPHIKYQKARKVDGSSYAYKDEILVKNYTKEYIQKNFIMDGVLAGKPAQTNDVKLSPVSVAFAQKYGYIHPYTMPTLREFFDFMDFYADYYKNGAGKNHPEAERRSKNAAKVRFNLEIKTNPRTDTDARGSVFIERAVDYKKHVDGIAQAVLEYGLEDRSQIQCFDLRPVLYLQKKYPEIRSGCLFGDFPKVGDKGDGTSLQDQNGENTPWLAGMYWPYRQTKLDNPFKVKSSGGFEGMALTIDGKKLLPLLEKPLVGAKNTNLLVHEFDLASKSYTDKKYEYPLNERGSAIGDFIMFSEKRGVVIERDWTQGDVNGFKAIYEVELNKDSTTIKKQLNVDLVKINDVFGISEGLNGDVGIGKNFAFPFVTIESVVVFNPFMIGVLNDNNYPFSIGRHVGQKLPDDNEFIVLWLDQPLGRKWTTATKKEYKKVTNSIKIFPSIFDDYVTFTSDVEKDSTISINIYNIKGNLVRKLVEDEVSNGNFRYTWNGKSDSGVVLRSGVYVAIIEINGEFYKKKLIKR